MPVAKVRGVNINYKVLGEHGPWVALSPGGRRDISGIELLAGKVAEAGHRVVIFDRRNCGASDVVIDGNDSEYEIWADDIHELLAQLGALPVFVGGSSSGCRTALLFALRHPEAVRGLLLWRVTGGRFACERLAEEYYGQSIAAAKQGGMAAVCEMEHWKERIDARPQNCEALMKVIDAYAGLMAADIAADRLAKIKAAGAENVTFAWAGPVERGMKHYYRVQGPTFLIEFDNTQNNGNHVHSVWRDFKGDFGRDLLREHVRASH